MDKYMPRPNGQKDFWANNNQRPKTNPEKYVESEHIRFFYVEC